jgi:hypothetical protein
VTIVATRTAKPKKVLKELGFQGCSSTQALAGQTILDRPDQHQAIWKVPKPSLARGTRQRGISTSGHTPGEEAADRWASDYGFGWFHVSMSFLPFFGCLVSFVTPQM